MVFFLLGAAAVAVLGVQLWRLWTAREVLGLLRAREANLLAMRADGERRLSGALEARRRAAEEAEAADLSRLPESVRSWVRRLEDPKLFQAAMYRHHLDSYYSSLFRVLRLPPGKLDALRDLLAERFKAEEEALRLASADGLFLDDLPERGSLLNAGTAETDQMIRALLGDEAYATFAQYQGSIQTRNYAIRPFADHERAGPNPLTEAQVDQLVASVPPYYFGVDHFTFQEPAPALPASLDKSAATVLSEPQLAAYNSYKAVWQARADQAAANQQEFARQLAAEKAHGN